MWNRRHTGILQGRRACALLADGHLQEEKDRKGPATMEEKSLQAVFKLLYLKWLADKGSHADPVKLFWKMAAGKMTESPFANSMAGLRSQLDAKLLSMGEDPRRKVGDRSSEANFRRLRAAAGLAGNPEVEFLGAMASDGVPIGVDVELPRAESVYEEKLKWSVEPTEKDFQEIIAENYPLAEENYEDIRRQVLEAVAQGTILLMSMEEAKKRFGGRLAVASLGAVPKELSSSRVRLIHDDRRINVRDKTCFPVVDDESAVLSSVEEDR